MKKKMIAVPALTALLLVATAVTASAEGETARGYLQGQQRNAERHAQFEQMAELSTDEERVDFFQSAGIGGAYSAEPRLDAEKPVDAGVIDQEMAGDIAAYASGKHTRQRAARPRRASSVRTATRWSGCLPPGSLRRPRRM